jgi:D-alanyl-D-alanine dipeptidase
MADADAARREYWATQMDEADAFMAAIMEYPVAECGEKMVSLVAAARENCVDVEFSRTPHVHGLPRLFYMREQLVPRFVAAAREMNQRGWVLKVEDGYRTVEMQRGLGQQESLFRAVRDLTLL